MFSKNHVLIIGHAGETPQLKSTSSSTQVVTFSVATTRNWKDKQGQKQEQTEWHRIVFWGKLAEVAASYVVKGSLILIEGRISTRSWTDKEGNKRQTTEIIGESLQLGPKPQAARPESVESPEDNEINADDMPF
jgi:single-strand DNA-binding protein